MPRGAAHGRFLGTHLLARLAPLLVNLRPHAVLDLEVLKLAASDNTRSKGGLDYARRSRGITAPDLVQAPTAENSRNQTRACLSRPRLLDALFRVEGQDVDCGGAEHGHFQIVGDDPAIVFGEPPL